MQDDVAAKVLNAETQAILNALPDIPSVIMNEEVSWDDADKEQEHVESVFSEIKINEIPETLLDSAQAIHLFVEWDMLKCCSNFEPKVIETTLFFLRDQCVHQLFESLFWVVNILKFQNDNVRLVKKLRKRISYHYTSTLSQCPHKKEDVLALLQFCLGYLVHMMHHRIFVRQRANFGVRFLLDCYHIVVYEMTGLLVSDVYIYNQIEKIFGERFFLYKQEGVLDLTNADLYEGSIYLEKTAVGKKSIERLKLDPELSEKLRKEVADFGSDLSKKFARVAKMLHANTKPNLLLAKLEGELAKKVKELTQKENFQSLVIERAKKIEEVRNKSKEDDNQHDVSQRQIGSDHISREFGSRDLASKDETEKLSRRLQKDQNSMSLPVLKIKQKFDCSQVSPPLQMAAKNVTASTKKKTIAFTSFNVPDFEPDKLADLYDRHYKQQQDKKEKVVKKEKNAKAAGPFDERTVLRYGYGSESLLVKGMPDYLRKKFTEFFVIKNVGWANEDGRKQSEIGHQ